MSRMAERLVATSIVAAAAVTFTAFLRTLTSTALPLSSNPMQLGIVKTPKFDPGFATRVHAAVLRAPLDQRTFNAWYVYETASDPGMSSAQRAAGTEQLARLGWRYTPAQLNLLYAYALTNDIKSVFTRADGLLRRDVAMAPMLQMLWTIERSGQARTQLTTVLSRNPLWRAPFLRSGVGLNNAAAVTARAITIKDLLSQGHTVSRAEIAPLIQRMVALNQIVPAYTIWHQALPQRTGNGIFDPHFTVAASDEANGLAGDTIPFEWTANSGNGLSVDFRGISGAGTGEVRIQWNGIGVPVLLRQTFRITPDHYLLKITGSDANLGLLSKLQFSVHCPGSTIRFMQPIETRADTIMIVGDRDISCQFATLMVTSNIEDTTGRFDLSLSGIELIQG